MQKRRPDRHLENQFPPQKGFKRTRLIIDGSPLKPYEIKRCFKLEQIWQEGRDIFSGCTHGSVIDISNAFYHIEMAEESKQYIGFEWSGKFYQYNNLQMGIHSAPFVFTEVTKPVVKNGDHLVFEFSNTWMIFQVVEHQRFNNDCTQCTCADTCAALDGLSR
jgi:hypothetical protein